MKAQLVNNSNNENGAFVYHRLYEIRDGVYGKIIIDEKRGVESFTGYGGAVWVREVLVDIDTAERNLLLWFLDRQGNEIEIQIPRGELTEAGVINLVKYGVQVNKCTAYALINCIDNEESKAPVSYQHSSLGYSEFKGETIFKAHQVVSLTDIKSTYTGNVPIEPAGTMEAWVDMVKQEVIGTNMEVILATALSATTVDYLHEQYPVDNIFLSLVGDSSTGKTTALMLAVSLGAYPGAKMSLEGTHMLTFLDTELSIIHRMQSGFPIAIDEGSTLKKNSTTLLYALANGREKGRMKKDLSMHSIHEFHTAIFASSEQSILALADENAGLRVRVMEIFNIPWTTSAESADRIKAVSQANYGWITPKFAHYLLTQDTDKLVERCNYWSAIFLERREEESNALVKRVSKKVGLILATAEMAEEAIGLEFDINKLSGFFAENLLTDSEDFDIGIKAYHAVCNYAVGHPEEFGESVIAGVHDETRYCKKGYITGGVKVRLYDGSFSDSVLCIEKSAFEEILNDNKIRDAKVVLRRLKELKLLRCQKDRYISKFKLGLNEYEVPGYKILLTTSSEETEKKARMACKREQERRERDSDYNFPREDLADELEFDEEE